MNGSGDGQDHRTSLMRTTGLPKALASTVAKKMGVSYHGPDALAAEATLEALARDLGKSHPGAAGSLREGLFETLTATRLGVPPTLARTLRSTTAVESMIEICRDPSINSACLSRKLNCRPQRESPRL